MGPATSRLVLRASFDTWEMEVATRLLLDGLKHFKVAHAQLWGQSQEGFNYSELPAPHALERLRGNSLLQGMLSATRLHVLTTVTRVKRTAANFAGGAPRPGGRIPGCSSRPGHHLASLVPWETCEYGNQMHLGRRRWGTDVRNHRYYREHCLAGREILASCASDRSPGAVRTTSRPRTGGREARNAAHPRGSCATDCAAWPRRVRAAEHGAQARPAAPRPCPGATRVPATPARPPSPPAVGRGPRTRHHHLSPRSRRAALLS